MGLLSLCIKPNFLGLLKCLNKLNWVIVFFSLINLSVCIYEDQIGKFDWRQSYVGRIKFAQFDTVSTAKKLIVATEENVLAALNSKTGQVVWRHVFESTSTGNIQLLHVADKVVTVTGSNPYIVRGWDSHTGLMLWEWSLSLNNEELADYSEFWVQQGMLVHFVPVIGSHIEVTTYNLVSGTHRGATSKLPAQWINDGCVLSPPYYTCISGKVEDQRLMSLDVTAQAVSIIVKPLSELVSTNSDPSLRPLDGNSIIPGFILNDLKIVLLKDDKFEVLKVNVKDQEASVTIVDGANGSIVLQTWSDNPMGFTLTAHSVLTGDEIPEIQAFDSNLQIPDPEISAALCTKARENVCRLLLTSGDDASHLIQQEGRVLWTREEALANVVAAEFVDLPVSDLDAAIESEFDQKEGSIWSAFSRRIQTQFQQLQTFIQSLQKTDALAEDEPNQLVRDYFNLHKIIVLVTDVGKIFGIDNLSGEVLWRRYEPALEPEHVAVFTRRSARHPPHDAVLTVLGKHVETGNAVLINLNPITGASVGEGTLHLRVRPLQGALLHRPDKHKLHALLLLDSDENVHIFPESSAPLVENMFMYVVNKNTGDVQGYALKYDDQAQRVVSSRTWSASLGGRVAVALGKPAWERARSPGAVLGDRSVLYKHSNPNLLLFVVDAHDPVHKDMVVSLCVDAVSGAVAAGAAHRRARALPLAVHADNALAYVYYNDKLRRTEVATLELYEGKQRWTAAGAAFSSLAGARAPAAERQAYILPASPAAAAATRTERSLTDKHVLLALSSGAIVELPWQLLEPRRPTSPSPTDREEGLIPYAPELPIPSEAIINYNKTVLRIKNIYTAPSGLESTSLVLATGLDIFYTRVAPSKTFDLLKDDFDYYLITIVLAALIIATYSTKYFASRKMLKMAWK